MLLSADKTRAPFERWNPERGALVGTLLAAPLILLICFMLLYPLGKLIVIAFSGGWENLLEFFSSPARVRTLRITFVNSAVVTGICILFGSMLAWTLRTSTSRLVKGLIWAAVIIPFLMGSVIKLYALIVFLERNGVVNLGLMSLGMTDAPLRLLYNQFAVIIGLTYHMLPFAVVPLLTGFQTINPDLVKAAESLGAGRIKAVLSTVVPLSIPSMLATGTMVYIICLGFYLTPEVLGGPTAPFTGSLIAQDIFQYYDLTTASISALILLVSSLAIVGSVYAIVGRERMARAVAG